MFGFGRKGKGRSGSPGAQSAKAGSAKGSKSRSPADAKAASGAKKAPGASAQGTLSQGAQAPAQGSEGYRTLRLSVPLGYNERASETVSIDAGVASAIERLGYNLHELCQQIVNSLPPKERENISGAVRTRLLNMLVRAGVDVTRLGLGGNKDRSSRL